MTLLFSMLVPTAAAFPGWYAGSPGASLSSDAGQVVIARTAGHTTLTVAQDVTTDTAEFAVVVPVPAVPEVGDVRELAADSLRAIDLYTAPRLVTYPCDAYARATLPPASPLVAGGLLACASEGVVAGPEADSGMADGSDGSMLEETVTVAARYQTGVYEVQVLEADQAGDLVTWLHDNGYGVPAAAEAVIQAYLDEGMFFAVAKVRLAAQGQAWLPPLQLSYESDEFRLPIRLGALNGGDLQELLIYTITDARKGGIGISNYPEVVVDDECLVPVGQTLADYYDSALDAAFDGSAGWVREYAWGDGGCDPCTGPALDFSTAKDLGFDPGEQRVSYNVSRFRMRYDPAAVTEDVMFSTDGQADLVQERFVSYHQGLTYTYPTCGAGYEMVEGAECYGVYQYDGCGSASSGCCVGGFALVAAVPVAGLIRRRRKT